MCKRNKSDSCKLILQRNKNSRLRAFTYQAMVTYFTAYCAINFDLNVTMDQVLETDVDNLPIALGISIYICE